LHSKSDAQIIQDHKIRNFERFEIAGASSRVRARFYRVEFMYDKVPDDVYALALAREGSANQSNFERFRMLTFHSKNAAFGKGALDQAF
jgi:hypothetical protein